MGKRFTRKKRRGESAQYRAGKQDETKKSKRTKQSPLLLVPKPSSLQTKQPPSKDGPSAFLCAKREAAEKDELEISECLMSNQEAPARPSLVDHPKLKGHPKLREADVLDQTLVEHIWNAINTQNETAKTPNISLSQLSDGIAEYKKRESWGAAHVQEFMPKYSNKYGKKFLSNYQQYVQDFQFQTMYLHVKNEYKTKELNDWFRPVDLIYVKRTMLFHPGNIVVFIKVNMNDIKLLDQSARYQYQFGDNIVVKAESSSLSKEPSSAVIGVRVGAVIQSLEQLRGAIRTAGDSPSNLGYVLTALVRLGLNKSLQEETDEKVQKKEEEEEYVGSRIAKYFLIDESQSKDEAQIFFGTVTKQKKKKEIWFIRYDDKDSEDMNREELEKAVVLYKENAAKDPKNKPCPIQTSTGRKLRRHGNVGGSGPKIGVGDELLNLVFRVATWYTFVSGNYPNDPSRLAWFTWFVFQQTYDRYHRPSMVEWRKMVRENYFTRKGIDETERLARLPDLVRTESQLTMVPSQNMKDPQCWEVLNGWYSLGFVDVASFVEPLSRMSAERTIQMYHNIIEASARGMGNLRAKTLLDWAIVCSVRFRGKAPSQLDDLRAFSQMGDKKAKVAHSGNGELVSALKAGSAVGEDTHVKTLLSGLGGASDMLDLELQADFNDIVGEIGQRLRKGWTLEKDGSILLKDEWVVGIFDEIKSQGEEYSIVVDAWMAAYLKPEVKRNYFVQDFKLVEMSKEQKKAALKLYGPPKEKKKKKKEGKKN